MKIFIGCSSSDNAKNEYKEEAKALAKILSKDNDLVFGTSDRGLMGIIYNEFKRNNRKIYAVCYEIYVDFLKKLEVDESIIVKTLGDSNEKLIELSDVIIFLPGGYGTLCELIYTLETKRTKNHNKNIIIFNVDNYYSSELEMYKRAFDDKLVDTSFSSLCHVVDNIDDVIKYIK